MYIVHVHTKSMTCVVPKLWLVCPTIVMCVSHNCDIRVFQNCDKYVTNLWVCFSNLIWCCFQNRSLCFPDLWLCFPNLWILFPKSMTLLPKSMYFVFQIYDFISPTCGPSLCLNLSLFQLSTCLLSGPATPARTRSYTSPATRGRLYR